MAQTQRRETDVPAACRQKHLRLPTSTNAELAAVLSRKQICPSFSQMRKGATLLLLNANNQVSSSTVCVADCWLWGSARLESPPLSLETFRGSRSRDATGLRFLIEWRQMFYGKLRADRVIITTIHSALP